MTSTGPREHERDWDAEFAEITGHFGGLSSDDTGAAPRTSANRVHFDGPDPSADDVPALDPSRDAAQWHDLSVSAVAPEDVDSPHAPSQPAPAGAVPASNGSDAAHPDAEPPFVPAAPRPLETDDPAVVIMIGALVGGPLWLVYLTVFDREAGAFWWLLASLTLVVGLGLAIARQPKSREEDDDDGARV